MTWGDGMAWWLPNKQIYHMSFFDTFLNIILKDFNSNFTWILKKCIFCFWSCIISKELYLTFTWILKKCQKCSVIKLHTLFVSICKYPNPAWDFHPMLQLYGVFLNNPQIHFIVWNLPSLRIWHTVKVLPNLFQPSPYSTVYSTTLKL